MIDPRGYFLRETKLEPEDAMLLAVLQRTLGVVDDNLGRNLKSALAKLTIDSQLPEPLRAITVPVKTWIRSLSPSRILVCTSTVSPISKNGISSFMLAFSTRPIKCWLIALPFVSPIGDGSRLLHSCFLIAGSATGVASHVR